MRNTKILVLEIMYEFVTSQSLGFSLSGQALMSNALATEGTEQNLETQGKDLQRSGFALSLLSLRDMVYE